jgi:hypothetical protein
MFHDVGKKSVELSKITLFVDQITPGAFESDPLHILSIPRKCACSVVGVQEVIDTNTVSHGT